MLLAEGGVRLCGDIKHNQLQHEPLQYATLSYCWGGEDNLKTTKGNISIHAAFIAAEDLPKAIFDAATLTNTLGIRFLWVDAVCIIQDDEIDKRNEIRSMRNIFKGSCVTIIAAATTNVHQSFLGPCEDVRTTFDIPLSANGEDRPEAVHLEISNERYYWMHGANTRAWCLEERYLSNRLLIFDQSMMMWFCETAQRRHPDARPSPDDGSIIAQREKHSITLNKIVGRWNEIVHNYSRRHLTRPEDSFNAIAGIAEDFAVRHGWTLGEYKAGFWSKCMDLLAWYSDPEPEQLEPAQYIAPSWSWLKCHQSISFEEGETADVTQLPENELLFEVLDIDVVNKDGAGKW